MAESTTPEFESARPILTAAIDDIIQFVERGCEPPYPASSTELMILYDTVYRMRTGMLYMGQNDIHLYQLYEQAFENYIHSQVLPSLRRKQNAELLQELMKRWNGHKIMTRWLHKIFQYLDRYHLPHRRLPSLRKTSNSIFRNLVYLEMKGLITDAVVSLIDRERCGEQIDTAMVKRVVNFYVEMGEGSMKYYVQDFEPALMDATATFYKNKAPELIDSVTSYFYYIAKVEEYLEKESDRVRDYLNHRSDSPLRKVVEYHLVRAVLRRGVSWSDRQR